MGFEDHWKLYSILVIVLAVLFDVLDGVMIYFYVYASTNSTVRFLVNETHLRWQWFCALVFIGGFLLCFVNLSAILFPCAAYAEAQSASQRYAKLQQPANEQASTKELESLSPVRFVAFIVAFIFLVILCCVFITLLATVLVGPISLPYIALSVAQKHTWAHGCDHYPVEVVLEGQWHNAPKSQPSVASFYFWQGDTRTKYFEYVLSYGATADDWGFELRKIVDSEIPESVYPLVQQVSYNLVSNTISGTCMAKGSTPVAMEAPACLEGTFDLGDILSFSLNDTRANMIYNLRAANKEWYFRDDAPSVKLQQLHTMDNGGLGNTALKTVVTKPGHCNQLKICLGMESGVDMIAPLGILLLKLDDYGVLCTRYGTNLIA